MGTDATCLCPTNPDAPLSYCGIDAPGGFGGNYGIAQCERLSTYEAGLGSAATSQAYCSLFKAFDFGGRVRLQGSPDATIYRSGWTWWRRTKCFFKWGYTWRGGACQSTDRYLGDTCWDGGECNNEGIESYDGKRLSCASLTYGARDSSAQFCVPSVYPIERNQCSCGWF